MSQDAPAVQATSSGAFWRWHRALPAMALAVAFALAMVPDRALAAALAAYSALHMLLLTLAFGSVLRRRWRGLRTLFALEAVSVSLGLLSSLTIWAFQDRLPRSPDDPPGPIGLLEAAGNGFSTAQFMLGFFALACVFPYAADDARLRGLEAERLRVTAELARLRAHLEPHFLLNTLNAVAGLVSEDPREARRLLAALGDLLRDGLQDSAEEQRLDEQVEWLQRYAQILESRHRGALRFSWQIEPRARDVRLPRLLLQPLVENAVQHGALRRPGGGGEVRLEAALAPGAAAPTRLVCTVSDNGPGLPDLPPRAGALGIATVRRRLALCRAPAALRFEDGRPGTRAVVELTLAARGAGA